MEPGGRNGVFPVFLFDRHSCLSRLESVGDDLERHFSGFSLAGAQNNLGAKLKGYKVKHIQPTPHWFFNDRSLSEIYDETYPFEE